MLLTSRRDRDTNKHRAFLQATSTKLKQFETALNQHNTAAAAGMLDDELQFYTVKTTREQAQCKFNESFRHWPDQWELHGTCSVTLTAVGDPDVDNWAAECDKIAYRGGEVAGVVTRTVFGGPQTRIRSLTDLRLERNWSRP